MIRREIPTRRLETLTDVLSKVEEILRRVRNEGDNALTQLALQFDGVELNNLEAERWELEEGAERLDPEVKRSIDMVWNQLESFHSLMKPPSMGGGRGGIEYGVNWVPIDRVGIYVPGGRKTYPSTLMMTGIPARVAGVKEIYVCTPVKTSVDPAIAYIALKLNVDGVYKVGGAQAIGALAYGTQTIKKVDKIVGPGNVFVQAAKYLVSAEVGIDGIEGPTELVVIADEIANPTRVALDLMAQGEHGPGSVLVLISPSEALLNKVEELLPQEGTFYLIKSSDLEEAVNVANELAPEHLSLYVRNADELLRHVRNAGAITVGDTPPALLDYSAGPDHVLPTSGWARFRGGLTVYDFLKGIAYVRSKNPDRELIRAAMKLAEYEGFTVHSRSMGVRYE
ncbi:MAG: histidinol dehydrogenase [Metallosphaera yellowstonensis]